MFVLLFLFVATIFFAVKGYDIVLNCLMNWCGMSKLEAESTIHDITKDLIYRTERKRFMNSFCFINRIWNSAKNVMGEQRYNQLLELSYSLTGTALYLAGVDLGLSFISITVFDADDSEKQRLEFAVKDVLMSQLKVYKCDLRIESEWNQRYDLNKMPTLTLYFATNWKQRKILDNTFAIDRDKIIARNSAVIDDTEEVDLFD